MHFAYGIFISSLFSAFFYKQFLLSILNNVKYFKNMKKA